MMRSTLRPGILIFGSLVLCSALCAPAARATIGEENHLTFDPPLPYSDQRIQLTASVAIGICDSLLDGFVRAGNRFELTVLSCPILPPPGTRTVTFEQNLGKLPPGTYTFHFAGYDDELARLTVRDANSLCAAGAGTLCLGERRFRVETTFAANGTSGVGRAVPLSEQTGFFWFFGPDNIETVVKVIDGCGLNGHFWVFAAGLTNVETTLTVTDLTTGSQSVYANPTGTPFRPFQNTAAFPCTP